MNEWEWQLLEAKQPIEDLCISGVAVRPGSRVTLRPRPGGDVMDIVLAGKAAVIESIEQDYEGKVHVCVVVDEDPGRDIGMLRQPGHRFFFTPEEVEPRIVADTNTIEDTNIKTAMDKDESGRGNLPRILVAGIGNIFLGDDAFGVEVVKCLAGRSLPENVRVVDFGIRGYDLAYALLDGYDITILVDACPRGEPAGTLYVIEPDLTNLSSAEQQVSVEAHSMNPLNVLRLAAAMGPLKRVLLVGCEPATLGPEEGIMSLSEPIAAAVEEAANLVESLIQKETQALTTQRSNGEHRACA
jgi:hydrogenase maturation protease